MDWIPDPPIRRSSPVTAPKWDGPPPPPRKHNTPPTASAMNFAPDPPLWPSKPPPMTALPWDGGPRARKNEIRPPPRFTGYSPPRIQRKAPAMSPITRRVNPDPFHEREVEPSWAIGAESLPIATAFDSAPPPPRRLHGQVEAPAVRSTARRVNLFDRIHGMEPLAFSGLKNAQPRSNGEKVYNTWEHYLQGLKPAWNGNRRLAIDVPGHGIESYRPAEDGSWGNGAEARLVCDLVRGAIEAEVPANGVALTCAKSLGVVVHGAQGGVITEEMFKFHIRKPGKRVVVERIRARQDAEGDIVLLSFARNIPDKPLDTDFVAENRGLEVFLSRAKESTVVVGDICAWCQERIEENELFTENKDEMSHFSTYIQDIFEEKDGISYGDAQRFLDGEEIMEAEFPKLLKLKLDGTKSIRQDKTTAELDDAVGRLPQDSRNDTKTEEKAKKKRRSKNNQGPNSQKKKNWFRVNGGLIARTWAVGWAFGLSSAQIARQMEN